MKINIFGSTGIIGTKSLNLLFKFYPKIKINLLTANKNYKKLILQSKIYKPKYVYINDETKLTILKKKLNNKIKILNKNELFDYLLKSKSELTILSISGYQSLIYLESIFKNTKNLGLVNKECVVSGGHLFYKLINQYKVNIFPLDSEHFSLKFFFDNNNSDYDYKTVYLTASGGPFLYYKINKLKKATFKDAIKHPKWKMGFKNSIDSATLVNKCLELIEAHYLFKLPFDKMKIVIHPQSMVHSIIDIKNHTSQINYFYHDMEIPLINFLNISLKDKNLNIIKNKNYKFSSNLNLEFFDVNINKFPIVGVFNNIDKNNPENFIKFNLSNEYAVELFKDGKISFLNIHKIIQESMLIDLKMPINTFKNIIIYHENFDRILRNIYEKT